MKTMVENQAQDTSKLKITRMFPIQAQNFSGNYDISEVNKVKNKLKRNIDREDYPEGGWFCSCAVMVNPDDTVLVGFEIVNNVNGDYEHNYFTRTFQNLEDVEEFVKFKTYLKEPIVRLHFDQLDKRQFFTDFYALKGQNKPELSPRTKEEEDYVPSYSFWINTVGDGTSRNHTYVIYGADEVDHYHFSPRKIADRVGGDKFRLWYCTPGNGSRIKSYKTLVKRLNDYGICSPPTEEELIEACNDDQYYIH